MLASVPLVPYSPRALSSEARIPLFTFLDGRWKRGVTEIKVLCSSGAAQAGNGDAVYGIWVEQAAHPDDKGTKRGGYGWPREGIPSHAGTDSRG